MAQSRARTKKNIDKRERQAKRRRIRAIRIYALMAGGVVIVAGGLFFLIGPGRSQPGTYVPSLGNQHILTVDSSHIPYNSDPPTSGPHVSFRARWGVYDEPLPGELQIHSLEDGGVVVQYNRSVDAETVSDLTGIVRRYRDSVILAPYPDMESPIALTAWTRIQKLQEFDRDEIERFINTYRGIDHHVR